MNREELLNRIVEQQATIEKQQAVLERQNLALNESFSRLVEILLAERNTAESKFRSEDHTANGEFMREKNIVGRMLQNEENMRTRDVDAKIYWYLNELGIPAKLSGKRYITSALKLCLDDESLLNAITKELYPTVAKEHKTTASRVERAMRHAIEVAWERGNRLEMKKIFGYTVSNESKPTNAEFIAALTTEIKRHL